MLIKGKYVLNCKKISTFSLLRIRIKEITQIRPGPRANFFFRADMDPQYGWRISTGENLKNEDLEGKSEN